ncbi:hypothetical protein BGZ98_009194 [Dissophora globulifera]|nr:hypothetical protein BGZ98_009194 [Dissophora globulifera]
MTSWDSPTAVSNLAAGVGSRDTGFDATPTLSRDTSVATHDSSGALDSASNSIDNSQWGVITQHMKTTNISDDQPHSNGAQSQSPAPPPDSEPTVTVQDVWFTFQEADQARDLDDVKAALARLCEAYQDKSWVDLEEKLREKKCNTYLVATEDQISFGYTLVNLKGESNQEYRVIPSFIKPGTVKRGRMSIGMAASYEDNLARLDRAGVVRPSGVRKCHNCKQDGHVASECSEDKREPERSEYYGKCYNCGAEDHRTRTCPEPRKLIACRTCGKEGHMARDCTDPNITCNRCNQEGHIARDCDEPRTDVTCRSAINLDIGHQNAPTSLFREPTIVDLLEAVALASATDFKDLLLDSQTKDKMAFRTFEI